MTLGIFGNYNRDKSKQVFQNILKISKLAEDFLTAISKTKDLLFYEERKVLWKRNLMQLN